MDLAWVLGITALLTGAAAVLFGLAWQRCAGRVSRAEAEAAGAAAAARAAEGRVAGLEGELVAARAAAAAAGEEAAGLRAKLEAERVSKEERERVEKQFTSAFEAMTARALKESRAEFIEQARPVFEAAKKEQSELVKPIGETLARAADRLTQLDERVKLAGEYSEQLRAETEKLTRVLARPEVRGRYGEVQLRRVAELAGMRSYCDFEEQASGVDESGGTIRPDMVVKLPNGRVIAVDAKTNIHAFIEAVNARDETEREGHLKRFAEHVADQAKKLAGKRYWSAWEDSPEFVVMFVPGDHFIDAALSRKPELLEYAAENRVILASPSTLIGLLRAVAVGWREQTIAAEARELFVLGKELHERAGVAFGYINELGGSLKQATERFNKLVGSVDGRLVPTLKKFEEAGAKSAGKLEALKVVEAEPRRLAAGGDAEVGQG